MEEITYNSYQDYKQAVTTELRKEAEGFVRIGYLLKVARDTDILRESGYTSVYEFASAEYNLSKDVVSRWISINDRFSKGGYSMELDDRFNAFGASKLAEMLTLPDEVVDVIPDTATREDIRDLKKELKKEQAISDLEVLAEKNEILQAEPVVEEKSIFLQLLLIWIHQIAQKTERFEAVRAIKPMVINSILDVLAPSGKAMITVRLPGAGSYIISIRGKDEPVTLLNMRTNERAQVTWMDIARDIDQFQRPLVGLDVYSAWEMVYQEDIFPADKPEPEPAAIEDKKAEKHHENKAETKAEELPANESSENSMNPPESAVAPAQLEDEKKTKTLMNEELPEKQLHVYTVQFRCTAEQYKALTTWAGNRNIKFKKMGVR